MKHLLYKNVAVKVVPREKKKERKLKEDGFCLQKIFPFEYRRRPANSAAGIVVLFWLVR